MHGKSRLIYFIEYGWLFTLLLFASAIYLNQGNIGLFFNSDILSEVLFFKDVLLQHGHYKDWILQPAPHFFPDMFVFYFCYLIVKNIYFCFLIIIWMAIVSTYIAVKLIYTHFFSVKNTIIFALIGVSSLFLLALKCYYPYYIIYVSFMHAGEFIAGLFLLGMQLNSIVKDKLTCKSYILSVLSVFVVFACSFSDLLFFIQFVIPIFFSYSFFFLTKRINFHRYLLFFSSVILPGIFGIFLAKYLIPNNTLPGYLAHPSLRKISFSTINTQFLAIISEFKSNINYLIGIILCTFFLILMFFLASKLFFNYKKNIKNCSDKKLFLSLFIFLSIFLSIVSPLFLSGNFYVTIRYMLPLLFYPLLLFFFPAAYFNSKLLTSRIFNYLSGLLYIYIIVSLLVLISKPGFKLHMSYYPEYVHCIDKALRGYGHNGMAQHWEATFITITSKENVEAVPMVGDLTPSRWLVNTKRFEKPINFIILDMVESPFSINKDLVYSRYGMPDKLVVCNPVKILIYSKVLKFN